LITCVRDESIRFLREFNEQYTARTGSGLEPDRAKAELFTDSWERIDRESDCSSLMLQFEMAFPDRSPTEWAGFFAEQQRTYKSFQHAVYEAVSARNNLLSDLKGVRDHYIASDDLRFNPSDSV
jgi:hypothetical protein